MGTTTIARELNRNNMLIGTSKWYPQNVNRILTDKRVCGWLVSTNEDRVDTRLYPQIISDEQYKRVQDIKASKIPLIKHKPTEEMNNLFNGISTCGLCNASVSVIKQIYKKTTVYRRLYCAKRKGLQEKSCSALSVRYDFIENAIYNHILNFDWKSFLAKEDNGDLLTTLTNDLVQKNNYAAELRKIIESSLMPELSFIRTLQNINTDILNMQSQLAAIQNEPITLDTNSFDITNKEDCVKYNLALRKVVAAINITRHPNHDTFTVIEFIYHVRKIKHIILIDSMTGDVISNITCTENDGNYSVVTSSMAIYYNCSTDTVEIEGIKLPETMALLILFMESQKVDKNIINKVRDHI
ncbi:recombinase family protein [Buttiauxella agrestis]